MARVFPEENRREWDIKIVLIPRWKKEHLRTGVRNGAKFGSGASRWASGSGETTVLIWLTKQ